MELNLNEKLVAKRNSLRALGDRLGVYLDDLPFLYKDETFSDTLTQGLAKQAISLRLSDINFDKLDKICNMSFNKDSRTSVEYGIDLIYGWLAEDMVAQFLTKNGFGVKRTGVDSERKFLKSSQIKSDLDISVLHQGVWKQFDIYFDSNGYWYKYNKIDIRESKWKELQRSNAGMLCVSNYGFTIVHSDSEHTFGPNGAWGGKYCATITGIKDKLVDEIEFISLLKNEIK